MIYTKHDRKNEVYSLLATQLHIDPIAKRGIHTYIHRDNLKTGIHQRPALFSPSALIIVLCSGQQPRRRQNTVGHDFVLWYFSIDIEEASPSFLFLVSSGQIKRSSARSSTDLDPSSKLFATICTTDASNVFRTYLRTNRISMKTQNAMIPLISSGRKLLIFFFCYLAYSVNRPIFESFMFLFFFFDEK